MENKLTDLILHGHFYQPPRENPNTGLIPKQASALPYMDWNEKICAECYKANTNSRYLSQDGKIISLTNNFEYISYNFGPTLLSWLEEYQNDVYELIIQADKNSIKRLGHGNAIAQSFNHTILPLDKEKDAKLQIEWGIEDFKYRFGRDPEGIWLPEAGINGTVIDLLSQFNIKFVILSPWQCKSVESDDGSIINLNGKPAPYNKSYIITGPQGGSVNAFFYEPTLASDISFGHALRSADSLYQKILDIKNHDNTDLIHSATDGEIYGHHEPYGDMALAALIQKTKERNDFVMTNYATVLEENPSTLHAFLQEGEEGKGTSWSCSHGVSRWYKNCGCHTGGESNWNQNWRTSLRKALNNNAERIDSIFNNQIRNIFNDKLSGEFLLHLASEAIIGKISMHKFIATLHGNYSFDEKFDQDIAALLTGIKNKHFSFTSCGFFFSDISGLEPQQDIKYALYAISLYQKYYNDDLLLPFLADLNEAHSNIKTVGTGMNIAQADLNTLSGEIEASLYFYLNYTFANLLNKEIRYGRYSLLALEKKENYFYVSITDNRNLQNYEYNILSSSTTENGLNLYFSNVSDSLTNIAHKITSKNIPDRMIDLLTSKLNENMMKQSFSSYIQEVENISNYALIIRSNRFYTCDSHTLENINKSFRLIKLLLMNFSKEDFDLKLEYVSDLINFIKVFGRSKDIKTVRKIFTLKFDAIAENINNKEITEMHLVEIKKLKSLCDDLQIEPDLRNLQNVAYKYYTDQTNKTKLDGKELRVLFDCLNFQ